MSTVNTTTIPQLTAEEIVRFTRRIDRTDGCWVWKGCKKNRYGIFVVQGKQYRTHRLAWTIAYGPIPNNLCVCHHCDNPACVRPTHLFLGTNQDNMDDKIRKGRQARAKYPPTIRRDCTQ